MMYAIYVLNTLTDVTLLSDGEKWFVDLKNGSGASGQGDPPSGEADVIFTMNSESLVSMFGGKVGGTIVFSF